MPQQKENNLISVCEAKTQELCISESDNSFLVLPDSPLFDVDIAWSSKKFDDSISCGGLLKGSVQGH